MALLFRKKAIFAKAETTYGTDATPTGAANAVLTKNMSITPIVANVIERDLDRPTLGNDTAIHDGVHVTCTFDVELAGSGVAPAAIADETDAPAWSALLQACGFNLTVTPTTSSVFAPVSSSFESVTIYLNIADQLHSLTGCFGTVSFTMNAGELPMMSFSFTGLYNAPIAASGDSLLSTVDQSAYIQPVAVNDTNTTTATLYGQTLVMESCSIDMGVDVQYRNLVNDEKIIIVDRNPTGSISFEAPDVGTYNWFTNTLTDTPAALQIVHGTTAGNILTFDAPKVQVTEPSYSDSQGQVMINANMRLTYNTGDDELSITCT